MEITDENKIREEIKFFATKNGGSYSEYYIGITRDLERRIDEDFIKEHIRDGLYDPNTHLYTAKAQSRDVAFSIEKEFQQQGMKRYNPGGTGKEDSQYIYCFKMKPQLNDGRLISTSDSIRSMIKEGKEQERLRWFKSFMGFFKLK